MGAVVETYGGLHPSTNPATHKALQTLYSATQENSEVIKYEVTGKYLFNIVDNIIYQHQ